MRGLTNLKSSSVVCLLCMTHFSTCCSHINLRLNLEYSSFSVMVRTARGYSSLFRFERSPHHFVYEFIIWSISTFCTVLCTSFCLPFLKISFIPSKGSLQKLGSSLVWGQFYCNQKCSTPTESVPQHFNLSEYYLWWTLSHFGSGSSSIMPCAGTVDMIHIVPVQLTWFTLCKYSWHDSHFPSTRTCDNLYWLLLSFIFQVFLLWCISGFWFCV
jgi:hypothetical protein